MLLYSKKALNELVSIYTSVPENSFYSNKLKEATSVIHKILNTHIEDMKKYSREYWKDRPLNNEYNGLQDYYGPHPNDTETEYYSEHFHYIKVQHKYLLLISLHYQFLHQFVNK